MNRQRAAAVLGLSPEADRADVERAFRRAAQGAHPDHGGDAHHLRQLIAARAVLRAPVGSWPGPVGGCPTVVLSRRRATRRWRAAARAARHRLAGRPPPRARVV